MGSFPWGLIGLAFLIAVPLYLLAMGAGAVSHFVSERWGEVWGLIAAVLCTAALVLGAMGIVWGITT